MKFNFKSGLPYCLACVLLLIAGGCASTIKIVSYKDKKGAGGIEFKTYQASCCDVAVVTYLWKNAPIYFTILYTPFAICDLPFSLVTDTFMLPLDLYWDANKEKREARKSDLNEPPDSHKTVDEPF